MNERLNLETQSTRSETKVDANSRFSFLMMQSAADFTNAATLGRLNLRGSYSFVNFCAIKLFFYLIFFLYYISYHSEKVLFILRMVY